MYSPTTCFQRKISNFLSLIFGLFITLSSSAQIPHLEIKSHRAQSVTYGKIDLSKQQNVKKYKKFEVQLSTVDTFAIQKIAKDLTDAPVIDDTLDILIYIHAMWGGVDVFENKILRTFAPKLLSPEGNIDKILPITWHSGMSYRTNLKKAYTIGKSLGAKVGEIMSETHKVSKHPVRFHLLCHSMGHQVFRGIYKVNEENENFQFEEIIFAAPDVAYNVFEKEWGSLSEKCTRLTYFVNKNDPALKFSEKRLKIKRLGKSGSSVVLPDNIQKNDVTNLTDAERLLSKKPGHGYFFASPTVRGIIIRLLNN